MKDQKGYTHTPSGWQGTVITWACWAAAVAVVLLTLTGVLV